MNECEQRGQNTDAHECGVCGRRDRMHVQRESGARLRRRSGRAPMKMIVTAIQQTLSCASLWSKTQRRRGNTVFRL